MIRLAALLLLAASAARADVLLLNDGREIYGDIASMDAESVSIRVDGRVEKYPRARTLKLKLVRVWGVPGETTPARVSDPVVARALAHPARGEDYPDDGLLVWLSDTDCRIERGGAGSCRRHVVSQVLRERGKAEAANVRVYYLAGAESASILYARALNPGSVSNLDDTSVEDGSENSRYSDYDRLRSLKFAVPDVATGTIVDASWVTNFRVDCATAPFLRQEILRGFEPALTRRFTVSAPEDFALSTASWNMPAAAPAVSRERGRVVMTWTLGPTPSYQNEDSMPPTALFAPSAAAAPARSWTRVAREVSAALACLRDADPETAALTDRLIAGKVGDEAKVRALYDWVAREIKYVPVSMGSYSWIPKPTAAILSAKDGDALDKPFLLYSMLRRAGLKPQLVYLRAREDTPLAGVPPSLAAFSAAAVRVELGGQARVIAPEEDLRRWDETPGWLQGVQGLVVDGEGLGEIVDSPLSPAAEQGQSLRESLALDADGGLSGDFELRPRGEAESGWRAYKDWKKEDLDAQFAGIAHSIHPNARLVSYSIEGLDDLSRALVVRLRVRIPGYALTASGGYMALRVPWTQQDAGSVGKGKREMPMFWYVRDRSEARARIALPKGYSVYYAPGPLEMSQKDRLFRAGFSRDGASLDYAQTMENDAVEVAPDDYPAYKSFIERAARYGRDWIVLRKD